MASPLARMKVLLILEENSWKIELKLFRMKTREVSNILWVIVACSIQLLLMEKVFLKKLFCVNKGDIMYISSQL